MAQSRTTSRSVEARTARIGSGARVRGRIHGEGDLVVEGQVEGDLVIRGNLTIAQGASVTGEAVEAHTVLIAGTLEGDLTASGQVTLTTGARVRSNVRGVVAIEQGAEFAGQLDAEFDLPPELGGASRDDARARSSARR